MYKYRALFTKSASLALEVREGWAVTNSCAIHCTIQTIKRYVSRQFLTVLWSKACTLVNIFLELLKRVRIESVLWGCVQRQIMTVQFWVDTYRKRDHDDHLTLYCEVQSNWQYNMRHTALCNQLKVLLRLCNSAHNLCNKSCICSAYSKQDWSQKQQRVMNSSTSQGS